mmetsp:Transcript_23515/g.45804  ORF Transcript_23515/g.45804 Transcript_23515/m.45804 type:complete len:224 (+) Transcript_23515:520-1191(+)
MYGLLSSISCTMSARMPICAARPLFSSMPRLDAFSSSVKLSQPKSMKPLRKSPGNSPVPSTSFITKSSRKPTNAKICARPAAGTTESALMPVGTDANGRPNESSPGRRTPADVTTWPRIASIQMRPCFSSTYRSRSNFSWSPSATRPSGSYTPCGPGLISPSKAMRTADREATAAGRGALKPRAATESERAMISVCAEKVLQCTVLCVTRLALRRRRRRCKRS